MREFITVTALMWLFASSAEAQRGGGRGGEPAATAKAQAPIDLTGYWTAVITEDWHTRMLTAPRGDFGSGPPGAIVNPNSGPIGVGDNPASQGNIPYNVRGAQAALKWDPAKDEAESNSCKAYGAPGVMRQPTHLHITWQDDNTLKIEADYGTQTRLLHFGAGPAGTESTLQGYSAASWTIMGGRGFERGGSLKVVTTHLKPGYYWKNGTPYRSTKSTPRSGRRLKKSTIAAASSKPSTTPAPAVKAPSHSAVSCLICRLSTAPARPSLWRNRLRRRVAFGNAFLTASWWRITNIWPSHTS